MSGCSDVPLVMARAATFLEFSRAGDIYQISFFDISFKKLVFSNISIFSICNIAMIQKMLIENTCR